MAVPRPMLLALLGVLLLGATFYASRGARDAAEPVPSTTPIEKVDVAPPPAKAKAAEPKPTKEKAAKAQKATATPAKPAEKAEAKPKPKPAAPAGRDERLNRAVENGKVAILFLHQGAADDALTAAAVDSVRGRGVVALSDDIKNVKRYGPVVAAADVTQAPAVLIVSGNDARVIEGFIDEETLRQEVADARR